MILYLDTSALVKLYVDEPGSASLREALVRAKAVYTHQITYVEIRAAFAGFDQKLNQGASRLGIALLKI